jgi:hypothetical protein
MAFGSQDGDATVHDPVAGDWPSVRALVARGEAGAYEDILEQFTVTFRR